jgi:hypothetical protein
LISVYLDSITSADDLTGIGAQGWSITSTFIDPQSGKSMDNTEKTQKGDFDHVTPPTGAPGYWKFPVLDKNKLLQVLNAQQCGPGTVKVKFHIESPAVGGSADVDINIPFTCGTQTSANSSIAINPTVHSAVTLTIKLTVTSTCVSTASPR